MIGTVVNTACILIGSLTGSLLKKGIRPQVQKVMFTAMGLASLGLGFNAFTSHFSQSLALRTFHGKFDGWNAEDSLAFYHIHLEYGVCDHHYGTLINATRAKKAVVL